MLTVTGEAKINLTLDILGRRDDGFHEVAMVMQSIGLHDTLTLEKTCGPGIELTIDVPGLAADASNLAWRAASLMQTEYGLPGGVCIRLTKRIPIAAGLAGGSTDAAAVLRGMDALYGLHLTSAELARLGATLGSDIPFCLQGGTMLATGRGEILTRLPDLPPVWVVLAKPPISVSTAWAYKTYDASPASVHPDTEGMKQALRDADVNGVAARLANVLECATLTKYDVIRQYKELMLQNGVKASLMSGSGPTVFGITESREIAEKTADVMRKQTEAAVFVTQTTGQIGEVLPKGSR